MQAFRKPGGRPAAAGANGPPQSKHRAAELVSSAALLRFFESEHFDAYQAVLYTASTAADAASLQAYLCGRLRSFAGPERDRWLLQLVTLAVERPGSALEQTLVQLCHASCATAMRVRRRRRPPPRVLVERRRRRCRRCPPPRRPITRRPPARAAKQRDARALRRRRGWPARGCGAALLLLAAPTAPPP